MNFRENRRISYIDRKVLMNFHENFTEIEFHKYTIVLDKKISRIPNNSYQ